MPYRVIWQGSERHCPNLVPYPNPDVVASGPVEPVGVRFGEVPPGELVQYKSLVHLWSGKNKVLLDCTRIVTSCAYNLCCLLTSP
jgi:hypothetical protein